ncbi:MAG: penicillin-binding transpeptidase domain-containing protein [Christensenellaceae bacterium]|jgi:penicillin-binding protein 2
MFERLRNRFIICFALVGVLFVVLFVQLYDITITQGGELSTRSEDRKVRTLSVKGYRGQITDINGTPLAYDQSSYNVEFTRDPTRNTPTDRAYYTDVLIRTVEIIEENDEDVIDTFSIVRDSDGSFRFDFGVTDEAAHAKREENWRKNMAVSEKAEVGPDVIYRDLRKRYSIPEEYNYEQARKLLSIWQEIQLTSYRAYVPVVIASNIDMETVALIEAESSKLDGINISESSVRVYPKDSVAAHIVGYTGKMTDNDMIAEMGQKGYAQDDIIGITGIESSMEQYLTGNSTERQGTREVVVNSNGKIIQELSYTPPSQGNNVVLTIDLDLQMKLEDALQSNINMVYEQRMEEYQKNQEKYDEAFGSREVSQAKMGAAIVMDPNTGNVLAMASYPSYDVNMFSGGISTENMEMLRTDISSPLFNKAIASKGIPGSIFKLVTGMGGLMEGTINLDTRITDEGAFIKGMSDDASEAEKNNAPKCWVKPDFSRHSDLNLEEAISVSCNYYFMDTAYNMGIDRLVYWGDQFGLTTLTGIELPGEVAGQVGSPEVLYDPDKDINSQKTSQPVLVRNQIMGYLKEFGESREIEYTQEQVEQTADRLILLAAKGEQQIGGDIRVILREELEIPETITRSMGWDNQVAQSLLNLMWNDTQTAISGIGAGITAVTPIGVARYVSALINGGNVYEAHIVDSITETNGNIIEQRAPELFSRIEAPQEYFDTIKNGMKRVATEDGGTAAEYFKDFEEKGYTLGGKTGTGVVSKIELENNAWFVGFAPYDDPEIVVVTYIPNGLAGKNAIPVAHDIMEYYLDGQQQSDVQEIPGYNSVLS